MESDPADSWRAKHISLRSQLQETVLGSWFNILFVFVPIGITLNYTGFGAVIVFCTNFVAIISSNAVLSIGIQELSLRVGDVVGALLSITFGFVFAPL